MAFLNCAYCDRPIGEGAEFFHFHGKFYHSGECAYDSAMDILLNDCGATTGTVTEEICKELAKTERA